MFSAVILQLLVYFSPDIRFTKVKTCMANFLGKFDRHRKLSGHSHTTFDRLPALQNQTIPFALRCLFSLYNCTCLKMHFNYTTSGNLTLVELIELGYFIRSTNILTSGYFAYQWPELVIYKFEIA